MTRSDWIDASSTTLWVFFGVITVGWAVAIWYSVNEFRKDRAHESADAICAEARARQAALIATGG